ncbi:hypothetical protein KP509_31G010000 [Ceratopteris richardii]|uniref:non-specific serine/threonine protein kinase n=1 Tax=Ceratopteris richardii TaxID=49495 RepID=A0A8T2QVJ6_CERRI|nr:hypothetical protein KP509_31G010000 [Ceratopteris richardii]
MVSYLPGKPWLQTSGFIALMLLSSCCGSITSRSSAESRTSSLFAATDFSQALGGAASSIPSVVYFNDTRTLACDESEHTPGYITTIFLFAEPFVFGCLANDDRTYYFSVALSGANFPNTPIWLANRYQPVKDNASLTLTSEGSLVLRDADGTQVWSANTGGHTPTGLRLTTQGNLILFDEHNSSLWQSFSYPVDLLVPGQYLDPEGILVAGFSSHLSPTGSFVAKMTKGGLILYENSSSQALPYFAVGYPFTPSTPAAVLSSPCNHTRLEVTTLNMTQVQLVDSPACEPPTLSTQSAVSFGSPIVFIRLEPNGILKGYYPDHKPSYDVLGDLTSGMCGIPNACGPYGICENSQCRCPGNGSTSRLNFNVTDEREYLFTSSSCTLKVAITCHNGDRELQHLVDVGAVDYFANRFIEPTLLSGSFDECKTACLRNCSCRAAFYRAKSRQCYLHDRVLSMIQVSDDDYMGAVKVQRAEQMNRKSQIGLVVGMSTATGILIALLGAYFFYHKCRSGRGALDKDDVELLASLPGQPRRFTFKELQDATWEFSQKLGVGGFGSVYKGIASDGSFIAVKQLENSAKVAQGMKEFRNEVVALSNINHQNLVHLKGFCADSRHRLLVYEYVCNGSLDSWLFWRGRQHGQTLDWKRRLNIAVQTARGLVFLHEQCRNRIIHLDIKPQNILLDENFVPKLSDFGLSRLINEDQDSAVTRLRGTPGYMAPECLVLTDATEKSDVYSFGMVLLEVVSGRKNVDVSRLAVHGDGEGWYFPALASRKFKEGKILDIIDKSLMPLGNEDMSEATRVLKIAFWCIQDNPSLRPTMGKTLLMLEGYSKVAQPPLSFSFGMRFHLNSSISLTPVQGSPRHDVLDKLEQIAENGSHGEEVQREMNKEDAAEQGKVGDQAFHAYSSPFLSHPCSPRASPIPSLLSHRSLPHSAFRQASPRQSPARNLQPPISIPRNTSPSHLSPVASPRRGSPLPLSPLSDSNRASPLHTSAPPSDQT